MVVEVVIAVGIPVTFRYACYVILTDEGYGMLKLSIGMPVMVYWIDGVHGAVCLLYFTERQSRYIGMPLRYTG